jgi:DNA-3-methyladenine glycosylase II
VETILMLPAEELARSLKMLRKTDPVLGDVIRRVGPCTLKLNRGGYEIVVRALLSQQISVAAARTIRGRLQALLPGGKIRPSPMAALSDAQLQSVGISRQKRGYLNDLTRCTLDGTLSFRRIAKLPDEAAIAELTQVKGVGRWTAQMYLIFSLGRPDVFAPDDLGLQNAVRRLYSLPQPARRPDFEQLAARWAPYRSVASWYLWRSLELPAK